MAEIKLDNVTKRYPDGYEAVRDMSLDIKDGEFMILVGPSGCGKTTALRMIAGLEDITEGELRIDGHVVNDLSPKDRDIAMVFQNYALYPLAFTTSTSQLVLPVGIVTTLIKGDVYNWGQIMTGALLGAAPPLVIYAFLMDYYIAGLTAGATKG